MTDYEKLKGIIDEIDYLIGHHVRSSAPAFQAWHIKTERFLIKKYGKNSLEHNKFRKKHFSPVALYGKDDNEDIGMPIKYCADSLRSCKAIFETYLEEMVDESKNVFQNEPKAEYGNMDKIFIVHGHDGELKQSVARIIEKQGIETIILSEQANKGRTIIEKFEDYSDVGGAICLFTVDDYGRAKNDTTDNIRARQNVVLETGYFMGKLGREHVVLLADKGIKMPSDLSGVLYTDIENWQIDLLKELKAIGYTVDFNKLF